ncbi:MAG: MBL fold metallo-hydrolase [Acetivibrionales bacterium]
MIIKCIPTGMFHSNSYIVGDNGEGVVIDSGVNSREILNEAESSGLKIKYIILTHSHIDHVCTVEETRKALGAKVAIHELEAGALTDSYLNGSELFGKGLTCNEADVLLKDGDVIEVRGLEFEIIHTPGHTKGGICIKVNNCIFTGDTLFKMSIGRSDLPGGNQTVLINSIRSKLMTLPDETEVFPGHGPGTKIGYEKKNNPFL